MKLTLTSIFALLTFSVIVKGSAWWVVAIQPVILSLGAVFKALDLDVLDVQTFEWKNWLPLSNKQDETPVAKDGE